MVRALVPALQGADPAQLFREAPRRSSTGTTRWASTSTRHSPSFVRTTSRCANLGAALTHLRRFDEAIAEYERALTLAPDQVQVRANLALAYYKGPHRPRRRRVREAARGTFGM